MKTMVNIILIFINNHQRAIPIFHKTVLSHKKSNTSLTLISWNSCLRLAASCLTSEKSPHSMMITVMID